MKNLQDIIISHAGKNFYEKLGEFRTKIVNAPLLNDNELILLREIVTDVRQNLDVAVAQYTEQFDGVKLSSDDFLISEQKLKESHENIDKKLLASIRKAIANVRKYQQKIFIGRKKYLKEDAGIKYNPIERVGICVPGASAPLPSTVIMTAVPAIVAGVKKENIIVISPPRHKSSIHPTILATCYELGITEVYRIGGIQAVAALTYGTPSIKNVYKIVGPGNRWVQAAKKEVFGKVGIDSIAGPSEVLIIANKTANPAYVAADMLSQAEHAPGSAVLFTDSNSLTKKVLAELEKQLGNLTRADDTRRCLLDYSIIVCFKNMDEAVRMANEFATEHLEIHCGRNSRKIAGKIKNAGAIFIGDYTPVATGDYFAGPSHTLPTGGCARFASALTSNDFIKSSSIIEYNRQTLKKSKDDIIRLAEAEGLDAHSNSVKIRFK